MGILEPFRAIGYITSSIPFSVQRLGTETFVTVSVGKAFQIYNVIFFLGYVAIFLSLFHFLFRFSKINCVLFQCAKLNLVLVGKWWWCCCFVCVCIFLIVMNVCAYFCYDYVCLKLMYIIRRSSTAKED